MTAPRQVVAGIFLFLTRSITQQLFLLRPDKETEAIYTYCLAEAAERFGITLYGWLAMSNHEHLLIRDNRGNYPAFMEHFRKMTAKAMNRLRKRRENFWSSEQPNVVRLVEPEDAYAKLIYLLANPLASHLVDRAADWPGASSLRQCLSGREVKVKRPPGFFREDGPMPKEVTLRVERLPGFEELSDADWREKIVADLSDEECKARAERRAKGRRVLGRKGVLSTSPMDRPSNPAPRGGLNPHVACRNPARLREELGALRAFRLGHRSARVRWCAGEREALFPIGTYRMLRFGVRCATPGDVVEPPPIATPMS